MKRKWPLYFLLFLLHQGLYAQDKLNSLLVVRDPYLQLKWNPPTDNRTFPFLREDITDEPSDNFTSNTWFTPLGKLEFELKEVTKGNSLKLLQGITLLRDLNKHKASDDLLSLRANKPTESKAWQTQVQNGLKISYNIYGIIAGGEDDPENPYQEAWLLAYAQNQAETRKYWIILKYIPKSNSPKPDVQTVRQLFTNFLASFEYMDY